MEPQLVHEPARRHGAQHARPVTGHATEQGRDGLAVDVHGVVEVLPPQLLHLLVRQVVTRDTVKDVHFNQLRPVRVDDSQEILTHPSDAISRRVWPDVDEIRIQRGNDGEQEGVAVAFAFAFDETVFVHFVAEVEVVHAVVPEQTVEAGRAADVLGEKPIDIVAVGEELAQPENRSPSIPGGSVVLTPSGEFAERGVDLVREVNPARNRLDQPHVHLEVARGEAVERHRAVIGNAVLVELAADQA